MADLSTSYMGLKLKNPIVVGSSDLTMSLERVRACEVAGAGAVVLKSLFEEQIEDDVRLARNQASFPDYHTEADDYIRKTALHLSEDRYLGLIRDARRVLSIPVMARRSPRLLPLFSFPLPVPTSLAATFLASRSMTFLAFCRRLLTCIVMPPRPESSYSVCEVLRATTSWLCATV